MVLMRCILYIVVIQCSLREVDKEIRKEYDAIRKVHMHLDDDHDGNVDTQESAEVTCLSAD